MLKSINETHAQLGLDVSLHCRTARQISATMSDHESASDPDSDFDDIELDPREIELVQGSKRPAAPKKFVNNPVCRCASADFIALL